ncbi:sialidase family protein [Anaerotruncus rubiinfantis]|uniref:sialidase family protein n=1 Tax=Anaerotruncus rubiinfantis TaxID=1720200 RepID=UPI0034A54FDE
MAQYKNVNEVPQIRDGNRPHKVFMDGFLASFETEPTPVLTDWRMLENGKVIHAGNHYVDEPFIIKANDGSWVCSLSIGDGQEADNSQRTTIRRSTDQGKTWEEPIDIEPADGPEGSKAVLLKTAFGRIYAFYIYNNIDVREIPGDNPPYDSGMCRRVDSLGEFCYRYSDDNGRTWSVKRYAIPMRQFAIDRENPTGGKILFGMNSAIPLVMGDTAFVPFTKVGSFGEGLFSRSEGVLFKSSNIMTERDVDKIVWETLPDGDIGLRAPDGAAPIAEEHSFLSTSNGRIHCVYRTIDGWPAISYSDDGGYTWTEPVWMSYADGKRVKCPRAANFAWKTSDGRYLYWFHNHGGAGFLDRIGKNSHYSFEDRNPVWLLAGREVEHEGKIELEWSQPEIVLYTDDPIVRISYPDLLEDDGEYYLTETNKDIARIHHIDKTFLEDMWNQFNVCEVTKRGLILESSGDEVLKAPILPDFARLNEKYSDYRSQRTRQGFTIDFWVENTGSGEMLFDNRTTDGRGTCIFTNERGGVTIVLRDDMTENTWSSDDHILAQAGPHHIGVVVDGGPNVISFVSDGRFNDGGDARQFGWGRFSPYLESARGGETAVIGKKIKKLRVYDRALRTTELIGNWRAGSEG